MRFLIDECLHTSLVAVGRERGHEASHVNWPGLSGETVWGLMPRIIEGDFTFVTNKAEDVRKLYAKEPVHVVDYVDELVPMLARMAAKRRTGYRSLGYTVESPACTINVS